MKNSEKADVFFKVATKYLDLAYSEYCQITNKSVKQVTVVNELATEKLFDAYSPYICDCVDEVVDNYKSETILKDEMYASGMPKCEFGVWGHIEPERRQEARWFFLMLMTEYLDNE